MILNILIVDDEKPVQDWLTYCIDKERDKFNIVGVASTAEEAFEITQTGYPDLIITDICMPQMDGLEFLSIAKKKMPYVDFIMLTNYAEFTYAQKALANGASDYILKSELRSSDLLALLNRFHYQKQELLKGKRKFVLADGSIDLYDLISTNRVSESEFIKEIGLDINKSLCLLCFSPEHKENKETIVSSLGFEKSIYCEIAHSHDASFFILQSDEDLEVNKIAERLAKSLNTKIFYLKDVTGKNLKQHIGRLELCREAGFFEPDRMVFNCIELQKRRQLNFKTIQEDYLRIVPNR